MAPRCWRELWLRVSIKRRQKQDEETNFINYLTDLITNVNDFHHIVDHYALTGRKKDRDDESHSIHLRSYESVGPALQ